MKKIFLIFLLIFLIPIVLAANVERTFSSNTAKPGDEIKVSYKVDLSNVAFWAVDEIIPEGWNVKNTNLYHRHLRWINTKGSSLKEYTFIAPSKLGKYKFDKGTYQVYGDDNWYFFDPVVVEVTVEEPYCGNNICEENEDESNCPEDCGDSDNDGIINSEDKCPDTLIGKEINKKGCILPRTKKFILSNLSEEDLRNVKLKLTKLNKVKLKFLEGVNIEDIDLDEIIEIKEKEISINSSRLNKTARLTFYNIIYINPQVYRDGDLCLDCNIISYSNNELIVDVPGFTEYSILEGPYCGDNICNSDETCSSCSQDCGSCPTNGDSNGDRRSRRRTRVEVGCNQISYNCSIWNYCNEQGYQSRMCTNITNCDAITFSKIQEEKRECKYEKAIEGLPEEKQKEVAKKELDFNKKLKIFAIILIIVIVISIVIYFLIKEKKHYKH